MLKFIIGILAALGAIVVLGVAGLVIVGVLATTAKPGIPKDAYLDLGLYGEYAERKPDDLFADLFRDDADTFADLIGAIEKARDDDRIVGLRARIGRTDLGIARTQELRDAVLSFRESGKWTQAYFETAGEWGSAVLPYYLSTGFDSVYLAPPGDVNLLGVRIATPFIRGTLDKLDIYPDMDHRGEYKSAKNFYTEKSYTVPHREMMSDLLDSIYDQLCEGIAEGRGLTVEQVHELMDNGPYTAREALERGLVDELLYRDELDQRLEDQFGNRKGLSMSRYLAAAGRPHAKGKKKIALVHGVGNVVRGESGYLPMSGTRLMGSTTVGKAIRDAADRDDIAAIILRVDSPGGSYVASDLIWREMKRASEKKPVVVSMGDVAASGGYFVALPSQRIYASPGTITASIGVLSGKMNMHGFYDKIGITQDIVQRGKNATMYWDYQNYTDSERERFENFLDRIYMDFTGKVAEAREMEWGAVDRVARGRVWTGKDAVEIGLVDELGGLHAAIEGAKELAEIDADEDVRLVPLPRYKTRFELLSEAFETGTTPSLTALRQEIRTLQQQVGTVRQTFGTDGVLSMPPMEHNP